MKKPPFLLVLAVFLHVAGYAFALDSATTQPVDAVVASVNNVPITIQDVLIRSSDKRKLSLQQASADPSFRQALESLILEELVKAEAKQKKIDVSKSELDRYVEEVAQKNNLSVDGLKKALEQDGKSFERYSSQVELEILKSKLISSLAHTSSTVSEDEIDNYLKSHPELTKSGTKIKISQILISTSQRSSDEAQVIAKDILAQLGSGKEFAMLAKEISDGPERSEGGSLGLIAEEDLSPLVFDAIFPLKEGEVSAPIESPQGLHLFRLDQRIKEEGQEAAMAGVRQEARRMLERDKFVNKTESYFTSELYKHHSVEKKI